MIERVFDRTSFAGFGRALLCLSLVCASAAAQSTGTFATVSGRVNDLASDGGGALLYCTEAKEVGTVSAAGQVTVIANAATGPFANALRGVVRLQNGDLAVMDQVGDIYRLAGAAPPAVKIYSDYFMVGDPTDLIVDGAGNYVTVSQTPSTGFKAINWMSADGSRWAYYLVKYQPCAIAQDPVSGDLVIADVKPFGGTGSVNGALRLVSASDESHPVTTLDNTTNFGFNSAANDGDVAFESNGNILVVAGGTVYRHDRASGVTSVFKSGLGDLHAIAIGPSSGNLPSTTGFSAYVAQGTGPTTILEITEAVGPAAGVGPSLGTVPNRGKQVSVNWGMNAFEITRDANDNLLVGGDNWGSGQAVRRLNLTTLQTNTIADASKGLAGRVLGLCLAPDQSIYAASTSGTVQHITEVPFSLTNVFTDPQDQVKAAEDLLLERNGRLWVATRNDWGVGFVSKLENGVLTHLVPTIETRGYCGDPYTGKLDFTEWINVGFNGRVNEFDPNNNTVTPLPGFEGVNWSNAGVWADGDVCQDVEGNYYTCSEDDWSVYKWNRHTGKLSRIGAGYTYHPAGVAIAKSTPTSGSTTGWSLFVAEYVFLWEIPSVPAPATAVFDSEAPPVGSLVGWFPPLSGTPRAIAVDPAGGGFYVSTSFGTIERVTLAGQRTIVAGTAQGLGGDLIGLATSSSGHLLTVTRTGKIYDVDPNNGYAAVQIFSNPGPALNDVRGLAVDGSDRILLFDRPLSLNASRVHRLVGGQLTLLAYSEFGHRGAFDPLSGDLFVPEKGSGVDGGGEILRLDTFATPATAGHYRGNSYFGLPVGEFDGGSAFDAQGNLYIPLSATGRVARVDRATGAVTTFAGNYASPVGCVIAPGNPGVAGPQGSSLFVLDRNAIFEVGIGGTAAPFPPSTKPNLGLGADLLVSGLVQLPGATPIRVDSPPDAGRVYLVVASLSGKTPGFPLAAIGDPTDTRFIPNNPDFVWQLVNNPSVMPDFYGVLDGNGASAPTMALLLPNDPSLMIGQFLDLAWVAIDFTAQSGIATVGATAQVFLGP